MQLVIDSMEPVRVILRRREIYKIFAVALKILGYVLAILGLLLVVSGAALAGGQAVTGFGLFFWGISHALRRNAAIEPSRVEFDNQTGLVRVFQKQNRIETEGAQIAYAKISHFTCVQSYDEGKKYYAAALVFTSGERWTLHTFSSEDKAKHMARQLTDGVDLRKNTTPLSATLPAAVSVISTPVTTFSWSFGFFSRNALPSYTAVAGFLWAMLAIVAASDLIATAAVLAFTGLVAGVFVYFGIRWVGARGELEIGGQEVRYFEKRGFRRRLRHSIRTAELTHVACGSPTGSGTGIFLLKEDEWLKLRKIGSGEIGVSDIPDAIQLMIRVFKIYTPTLNFSEQIRFAAGIEEAVAALKKQVLLSIKAPAANRQSDAYPPRPD